MPVDVVVASKTPSRATGGSVPLSTICVPWNLRYQASITIAFVDYLGCCLFKHLVLNGTVGMECMAAP